MPIIRVASWNARGLFAVLKERRDAKLKELHNLLYNNDVVLIQEAHLAYGRHRLFIELYNKDYVVLTNHNTQASAGTCSLVSRKFLERNKLSIQSRFITKGYSQYLRLTNTITDLLIVNVYLDAGSIENKIRHIDTINQKLPRASHYLFGGDFNFVESLSDRASFQGDIEEIVQTRYCNEQVSEYFQQIIATPRSLIEVTQPILTYKHRNTENNRITWVRLDRFYVNASTAECLNFNIFCSIPFYDSWVSDHRPITFNVENWSSSDRSNLQRWVINHSEFPHRVIQESGRLGIHFEPNPWLRLGMFHEACFNVQKILKFSKRPKAQTLRDKIPIALAVCRYAISATQAHRIPSLVECYPALESLVSINDHSISVDLNGLNRHINMLANKEIENDLEETLIHNNMPKNIIKKIAKMKPGGRETLHAVLDETNNTHTTEPRRISEITREHWEKIWAYQPIDEHRLDPVLQSFHKRIDPDLDFNLTSDMVTRVIMSSKDSACGPDNIPFMVYRRCVDQVSPIFFDIIVDTMSNINWVIPDAVFLSNLFLLPKKEAYIIGDIKVYTKSSVRPISVAPCCIRVISSVVRIFLERIAYSFVNPCQSGFMRGRKINERIHDLLLYFYQTRNIGSRGFAILVDFSNAFSAVSHEFIRKVLAHIGVPIEILRLIELFLKCDHQLIIKGSIFDHASVFSGTKQGDPSSPLIFIIVLEILIDMLNKPDIDPHGLLKHGEFADDMVLFRDELERRVMRKIIKCFEIFASISLLKVNVQKTILLPTNDVPRPLFDTIRHSSWRALVNNILGMYKYLGVLVGKDVTINNVFDEQLKKFDRRTSEWFHVPLSQINRIRVCNVWLLPILSYINQFFLASDRIIGILKTRCMRFIMRTFYMPNEYLTFFLAWIGFKPVLVDVLSYNLAALLRASFHLNPDMSNNELHPYNQISLARKKFEEITDLVWDDFCLEVKNPEKPQKEIMKALVDNNKWETKVFNTMKVRIDRWNPGWDNSDLVTILQNNSKDYVEKTKDYFGIFTYLRLVFNGVFTKRRSRFWRVFLTNTCVLCNEASDEVEHWLDPVNPCSTIHAAATRVGILSEHERINLEHFLALAPQQATLIRFWKAVIRVHEIVLMDNNNEPNMIIEMIVGWFEMLEKKKRIKPPTKPNKRGITQTFPALVFCNKQYGRILYKKPDEEKVYVEMYQKDFVKSIPYSSFISSRQKRPFIAIFTNSLITGEKMGFGATILGIGYRPADFSLEIHSGDLEFYEIVKVSGAIIEMIGFLKLLDFISDTCTNNITAQVYFSSQMALSYASNMSRRKNVIKLLGLVISKKNKILESTSIKLAHLDPKNASIWSARSRALAEEGSNGIIKENYSTGAMVEIHNIQNA